MLISMLYLRKAGSVCPFIVKISVVKAKEYEAMVSLEGADRVPEPSVTQHILQGL